MAQSIKQVMVKCDKLSIREIEARITLAEVNPATSEETLNNYKTVLHNRRISEGVTTSLNEEQKNTKDILQIQAELEISIGEYWVHLRKSSLKRGKDFNLTFADVKKLVTRKTCFYTKKKLDSYRTTERLDANKGYVKGNVVAVCSEANQLKNLLFEADSSTLRMSLKDLKIFVESMEKLEETV